MLKKRLVGVISVLDGWAVQSIKYKKYLPLGRPAIIAENLDRFGVDEIIVLSIDRSKNKLGPDKGLLNSLSKISLSTPLSYGGGINNLEDANYVICNGAERIVIDSLINIDHQETIYKVSCKLGSQALIASLPVFIYNHELCFYDYRDNQSTKQSSFIFNLFQDKLVSEAFIIDFNNEGLKNGFDMNILSHTAGINSPLIIFGGISETIQIEKLLEIKQVSAVAIGNFLNYTENSVQIIKDKLNSNYLRSSQYYKFV
ncbi:HisA/HisF-related TIM barrel protein [Prochlorococcus sp. AH-716-F13]|nr:HisA/HisF-related TIM barrel protein [Prochlorococcus sp. AH-716-F13]